MANRKTGAKLQVQQHLKFRSPNPEKAILILCAYAIIKIIGRVDLFWHSSAGECQNKISSDDLKVWQLQFPNFYITEPDSITMIL